MALPTERSPWPLLVSTVAACLFAQAAYWGPAIAWVWAEKPEHARFMPHACVDFLAVTTAFFVAFVVAVGQLRRRRFLRAVLCCALGFVPLCAVIAVLAYVVHVEGVLLAP